MEDKIFNQIEQKFKELVFEIQMQDNKKIIEFQDKLKALKEKLTLEEQMKKINEQNEEIIKTQRETINLYKCDN